MHYLYLVVTFVFLVVFVTFTAANLQEVAIDFWPFQFQVSLPFALVLLGSLLGGFLIGTFLMWLRFGAARARARRAEQRAAVLERELVELKRRSVGPSSAVPPAGGPAGAPKAITAPDPARTA